jgi:hypothetical protein
MSAEEVLKQVAARLRGDKTLDPGVVKSVIDSLVESSDPVGSVDALDSQLYTIAMRRAEKK